MAESDSVNQPLDQWASHPSVGSGGDGPYGSGESYTQLFGPSIHTSRHGKPLGGPVLEAWLRCFPTC